MLWFRRDLRLSDHPALAEAAQQGPITALFVLDDVLLRAAGKPRLAYLLRTLRGLEQDLRALGGALTVCAGRPEHAVPAVVAPPAGFEPATRGLEALQHSALLNRKFPLQS